MRAVRFDEAPVFTTTQPDPMPGDGECLVRVRMAGICATDLQILQGYMNFTGVLGHEMVGTVVEGSDAWRGKRVVCEINGVCRKCDMCLGGLAQHCRDRTVMGIAGRDGCFADFVAIPEHNLHAVPDVVSDEQAVFVEPLAAAYQVLTQCSIDARMNACVIGTGRLGLLVAQVLAGTGCKLMAVGRNPKTLLLCEKKGIRAISIDEVIPRQEQDVVIECSGSPAGLALAQTLVRPRGTIVLKSTYAKSAPIDLSLTVIHEVNILGSRCGPFPEALRALAREAVEVRSMISRSFPIEKGLEALDAARAPENVKVLLKINSR